MKQESIEQQHGKPWKIEAKFKTYEEAKQFRSDLEKSENPPEQVKIKYMSSSNLFVVKTRKTEENEGKKTKKKK